MKMQVNIGFFEGHLSIDDEWCPFCASVERMKWHTLALTPILQENIDEIISAQPGGVYSSK